MRLVETWGARLSAYRLIIISVMFTGLSIAQPAHARPQSIFIFPLSAPHLGRAELRRQTKSLRAAIKRKTRFRPTSARSTRRVLSSRRSLLKRLKKPLKVPDEVRRACRAGDGDFALSVYMELGTDTQPAKLKGALFSCLDPQRQPELFETLFEGQLTRRVWKIFAEVTQETSRRRPKRRLNLNENDTNRAPSRSATFTPSAPALTSPRLPPRAMSQPSEMSPPSPPPEPKSEPAQTGPRSVSLAHPRFEIWGGGRLFVRDFLYDTSEESALLRGGIRYSSGWIPGGGGRLVFRPFALEEHPLIGRLSLIAEYERFQFNSIYIIPDPFGLDGKELLPTTLQRWGAGIRFSHGLMAGARVHLINLELRYRGLSLQVAENPEYLGTDYQMVALNLLGIFSLIPGEMWFDLGGGFMPWVGLADSLQEVGESSQNIGASALMGVRYRLESGLSMGISLALDFVFYDPEGQGRSGRIGESARDQLISLRVEAGWMSDPLSLFKPLEMSSPPPEMKSEPQQRW